MSSKESQKPPRVAEAERQVRNYSMRIDGLLKDYLGMIDEYTSNRELLERAQRDAFMGIAKASIESRDVLYCGEPCYPLSMRATRFIDTNQTISTHLPDDPDDHDTIQQCALVELGEVLEKRQKKHKPLEEDFAVNDKLEKLVLSNGHEEKLGNKDNQEQGDTEESNRDEYNDEKKHKRNESTPIIPYVTSPLQKPIPGKENNSKSQHEDQKENPSPQISKQIDPLRWFGFFTPQSLRQAQFAEIRSVEEIIPKLANINANMLHTEIAIRRARKRRLVNQQIIDQYDRLVVENKDHCEENT